MEEAHKFVQLAIMLSSLLGSGTVQSSLFRYNKAESSVRIGKEAVLSFSR